MTLSDSTTLVQSGPGSDCNKEVLCILQSFSIDGASQSDYLISYPGYSLAPVLLLCRDAVGILFCPS